MSQLKINFLNWRPDAEDLGNQGLTVADNILHDSEGYVEFKTPTTFATNTALGTCPSMVVRSVGTNSQRIVAYLHNAQSAGAGFTIDMSIGLFSANYTTVGNYTTISSSTLTSAFTGNRITAFDVTEYADKIFITAQCELPTFTIINAGAPIITLNSTGYVDI